MNHLLKISVAATAMLALVGCKNDLKPNYQYFPNMYESAGYETYAESDAFDGPNHLKGQTAQLPAEGSVKRGFVPYDIPNTTEGYDLAKATLQSPLDTLSAKEMAKAKELYNVYCAICHGEKGNGQGKLVQREKFLGVPNYADREMTPGSVFHVITYGLNSMGSHANQLSQTERWMVADYVMKLQSEL